MGIFSSLRKKGVETPKVDGRSGDKAVSPRPFIAGRYEIHRVLGGPGKSGMGIVYVCYDHEEKGVLALKTFQDEYLTSKKARDSFKKEALLWVMLDRHPYIVRAFWVQELDYRLFVACEFVAPDDEERNTLTHYLRQPISLKQALIWSIQFCDGMEYAVSKGVTPHRDIKPDNIMITRNGMLKITDFGLAGMWQGEGVVEGLRQAVGGEQKGFSFLKETGGKIACGTPPWMAPEQFDGAADVRSDVYSFGVVLYQMASGGRLPFVARYPKNASEEEAKRFWREMRELHSTAVVSRLSSTIFPIIGRCLEKDPGSRYAGFEQLRSDLEAVYKEEVARRTGEKLPLQPELTELDAWELSNKGVSLDNLGLHDEAIRTYREAIKTRPEYAEAHNNLGSALKAKGDVDGAIKEYQEALKIRPELADAHINLGDALDDKGDLDGAIEEYREAIKIRPEDADAHYNLGNDLKAKGDLDGAIKEYREAIKIRPEDAEAHHNLGAALKAKGDLDGAIEEDRVALKIRPEYADAHYNLGNDLKAKGDLDGAIKEYREALRIQPDDSMAHFNLGNALKAKCDLDGAIQEYREAIKIRPEYAKAHINLGDALDDKGDLDGAIEEYREALRLQPEFAEAHYNLGIALEAKGNVDGAIEEYREALRIRPEYAEAHYNLGIALKAKGDLDGAIRAFEDFIRYAPRQYAGQVEKAKQTIAGLKKRM
jgi:tetratricopeptide (TPR) repeat protein